MKPHTLRTIVPLAVFAVLAGGLTGCQATAAGEVEVVVGYQSKTINTVTAGTLLRARGYLERRLQQLGERDGKRYRVSWQDYSTGAPITAQMLAGKIDIGSMGDYPMLINGSRSQKLGDDGTRLVSMTGHNPRGALNMVLARPDSTMRELAELKGKRVSASIGSAGHGTLVRGLTKEGLTPSRDVQVQNQEPAVGASALESGAVEALSQFVAWPGKLVFDGKAKALFDGAELNLPTLHGVVVRDELAEEQPEVLDAFLKAQIDATNALHDDPLRAAQDVAAATGFPAEVVYLYNGAGGQVSFDPTIKAGQREALAEDVPFLKSISKLQALDLDRFIVDGPIRAAYGDRYAADAAKTANPRPISGTDPLTGTAVDDPATASELWFAGEQRTIPAVTPSSLLRQVKKGESEGRKVRVGYVPDAITGTRWFADKAVWLHDPSAAPEAQYLPFVTPASARKYRAAHPHASEVTYDEAVKGA